MTLLECTDLIKTYRSVEALRGVSFSLEEGELVGLLGPNGAGKSTLVKICCGLVQRTGGMVKVAGADPGSYQALSSLGYLAELFRFPGWLDADEVLLLHQRLMGSEGGKAERDELLDLVDMTYARERKVGEMSKGMQQRLGIAQALINSPRLLILDEPTSALDPAGRRAVRDLLAELRRRNVSVLLNSHLLSEIELVCDRVLILMSGEIVTGGHPAELVSSGGVAIETGTGTKTFPDASRQDIPGLVAQLVAGGEAVYEVRPISSTLEDVYLEAVEGTHE